MSRGIVVDGSVSAAWALADEETEASEQLLQHVLSGRLRLVVPAIWRCEMLNVLRTAVLRGRITERDALRSLALLGTLRLEIVSVESQGEFPILAAALELGLTAYDAAYVNLAEARGLDLISADNDLLRLRSRCPWIRPVGEFLQDEVEGTSPGGSRPNTVGRSPCS